jgi:phosphatidylglycerophosphate synthase
MTPHVTTASSAPDPTTSPRRILATRHARWTKALAHGLAAAGVRPNAISMVGVGFAVASGTAFYLSSWVTSDARIALLAVAAACIQLRLLCNLLDGMLAVEEGLKSATGEIFNDLPDRVADVLILVGAGYAAREVAVGVTLGWSAAVVAVITAYVRVLAGSLGLTQHFIGPMAKQHRMFTLTAATLLAMVEGVIGLPPRAIAIGLALILVGSIVTAIRRTGRLLREANTQ